MLTHGILGGFWIKAVLRTLDWKARGFTVIEDAPEDTLRAVLELVQAILEI